MQDPSKSREIINTRHYMWDKCKQGGGDRRLRRKTLQHFFGASRILFQINAKTLPQTEAFPYLGWKIAYNNSDWETV